MSNLADYTIVKCIGKHLKLAFALHRYMQCF